MHIILAQLGGNKFVAMTGAKNFVKDGDTMLQFDIGRGATNKATKVRIELTYTDTYTVSFHRWNAAKMDLRWISTHTGVYADDLRTLFTRETGMVTSL